MKIFMVCVGGTYGAEDYYVVKALSKVVAQELAKEKYEHESKKFNGTYLGSDVEMIFNHDGVSQLLSNQW